MRGFILGVFLGFFFGNILVIYGDNISAPPPMKDTAIYHYLREIYENLHRLEVVAVNPDGARNGKRGDMLMLQTGGETYHCENTDSLNTWRCIKLDNVP